MKITIKPFYITFLLLTILCCGHKDTVFDKAKWSQKIDGFYQYRDEIVEDLISNHLRKGMSYKELQNLLGEPENYTDLEENTIAYGIMEDYGWNIDPVETKTLRIELTEDSLVSGYKIIHWKN